MSNKLSIDYELQVPFYDVDSMGIVWHGNYVKYLEDARCALLNKLGYGYMQMQQSDYVWPLVDLQIKYTQPLMFEQKIIITASLQDYQNGLLIAYQLRDSKTGARLTRARTRQVAVRASDMQLQICTPNEVLEHIEKYLEA